MDVRPKSQSGARAYSVLQSMLKSLDFSEVKHRGSGRVYAGSAILHIHACLISNPPNNLRMDFLILQMKNLRVREFV